MTEDATQHDFKTRDASSYDPFVDKFDRFVSEFYGAFAHRMLRLAQAKAAQRILDVGTGTGVVALRAGACVGPDGGVVGVDLSDGMLRTAGMKATEAGLRQVTFQKMDAEALQLEDDAFDVVLSLFALTHFPDPLTALREMFRVLRPGGRLVVGVGGMPGLWSRYGFRIGVQRLRREILERLGKQLTAPHFLDALTRDHLGSVTGQEETEWAGHRFGRAAIVRRLVTQAGFVPVSFDWQEQQVHLDSPDVFWEIQTTWSSITRKRVLAASADDVAAVREAFSRRCHEVISRGGALVYPLAAFYVGARKPQR